MQLPWTAGDGTPWVGLAWIVGIVGLGAAAALIAWIYRDARARGSESPGGWALAAVCLPIPCLFWYLYRRDASLDERSHADPTVNRILVTWALGTVGAFAIATAVSPPDPATQLLYTPIALVVTLPIVYVVVYPRWIR